MVLRVWISHSEKIALHEQRLMELSAIGDQLLSLACSAPNGGPRNGLIHNLVQGFFIFFKLPEQQTRMLSYLLELERKNGRPEFLKEFLATHGHDSDLKEAAEWPFDSSFIEVRKEEEENGRLEFNQEQVKVSHRSQAAPLALQLICRPILARQLPDYPFLIMHHGLLFGGRAAHPRIFAEIAGHLNEVTLDLLVYLLLASFSFAWGLEAKAEYECQLELVEKVFDLLAEEISRAERGRLQPLLLLLTMTVRLYLASGMAAAAPVSLVARMIGLIGQLVKLESKATLEKVYVNHFEGIEQLSEQVFETSHPYERGRQLPPETFKFPGAIAIFIELDKRCQSDANNDFLSITGETPLNWSNQSVSSDAGLTTIVMTRISGQPTTRKFILLGSRVQFEFKNSGVAQQGNQSLTRWGFRVVARPIYGLGGEIGFNPELKDKDIEETEKKFLQAIKLLTVACSHSIVEEYPPSPEEDKLSHFMKLSLMENGLFSQTPREELSKYQDYWVQSQTELVDKINKYAHVTDEGVGSSPDKANALKL